MIHWLILLLVSATCIGTPELFPLAFTKLCRQMVLWTLPLLLFLHLITNRHCRHSSANTIYPNTAISIYSEGGSIKCKVNPECVIYKRNVYSCCPSVDMEHWAPGLLLSSAARSSPSSRVGERQQAGYTFCTSCWSKINYLNSFFPAVSVLIPSFWRHPMDLRCFFFSYHHQFSFIPTFRSQSFFPPTASIVSHTFVCLDSQSGGHVLCRRSTPSFHALNKAHATSALPF